MNDSTPLSGSAHISPIETRYKGYRFRSRLEARWAVFFETLGKDWRYEVEGYLLPNGTKYLPDFIVDDWRACVEIKPGCITTTERMAYLARLNRLEDLGFRTMLIAGEPWAGKYTIWRPGLRLEDDMPFEPESYVFAMDRRDEGVLTIVGDWGWQVLDRPLSDHDRWPQPHSGLDWAYESARGARFEHGECG